MSKTQHQNLALKSDDGHLHLPHRQKVWRGAARFVLMIAVLMGLGAARVLVQRAASKVDLDAQVREGQRIFVTTVTPTPSRSGGVLTLPATLRGDNETGIYARVNGYVRKFNVEIGDRVTKGEVLAELETPELDEQVRQAAAQVEQAKANVVLGKVAFDRWKKLFSQDSVAAQDLDTKKNAYDTAVAGQAAAEANLKQLQATTAFKNVLAPFDGVITARNVDIGNLVDSGSAGVALFSMAVTDPLRVFVDVPQAYTKMIHVGTEVPVRQAELPGQVFKAVVTYVAGAIDITTRSLRIELMLHNPDGRLKPGAYVQIALPLAPAGAVSIPANTLLFRAEGTSVAVVAKSGTIRLQPIMIARDLGASLEVAQGVTPSDQILLNPPDSIANGDHVTVVSGAKPAAGK